MATGFAAGGGFEGGGLELAGGEEEFPEGGVELAGGEDEFPAGGADALWPGPAELPPQPASARPIIAVDNSRVVVVLAFCIVLGPIRRRIAAVTDRGQA
ncbi:MAG TPA: hypothetical protein VGN43_09080 [Steroidobacteraceae bacterium]|jgi:hypothetical protein|nr:hypothetical protein [Steroidobacteraceae bacterium]